MSSAPWMFSAIIQEYDEFLLDKYYERDLISDFAQALEGSSADYIDIATYMSERLESIIENLTYLEDEYPDFRSKRTGYSFAELRELYEQLRDVQYAKYYGNIRAGNLAKDPEMVIKGYQTRVKDLTETMGVDQTVADNYKNEITTFYDPYKEAGLYNQANQVQNNVDASNNRDQDVLYDVEEYINTYDNIILSYTEHASAATDAQHTIEHYNSIIEDFSNDTVSQSEKDRLLEKNQAIFEDILDCSARYSALANQTINEVYYEKIQRRPPVPDPSRGNGGPAHALDCSFRGSAGVWCPADCRASAEAPEKCGGQIPGGAGPCRRKAPTGCFGEKQDAAVDL